MYSSMLHELDAYLGNRPIDAFICCASFEERSKSIATYLNVKSVRRSWIFINQDYQELSAENAQVLTDLFIGKHTLVRLDTRDPLLTADRISSSLLELRSNGVDKRIVIDITAFTRESLLILLKFLFDGLDQGYTVEFLYSNASEYSVGDASDKKWLSKGNREIRSVMGYPGVLVPSKQCHLIVLVGFENERALSLIDECEPSRISLGIANELEWATTPHQTTNVARLHRLINVVGAVEQFKFLGYDAGGTKKKLEGIIERVKGYNTVIAPMNTKISTLGAAMVALENESVQICYAQANIYNVLNYSAAGSHFFHLSMSEFTNRSIGE